jgi:hypothetical protein
MKKIKQIIKESVFIKSFKADKRFWPVLLFNLIFIILVISLISSYTFILRSNLDTIKPLNASTTRIQQMIEGNIQPSSLLMQDLELVSSALHLFFLKMVVISVVSLLLLIAITGYLKTIIWSKITKEKFDKHNVLKLSLLLLLWNLLWVLLSLFLFFGLKFNIDTIRIITVIEFFVYVYFSLLIIPVFFRSKKIIKSIKETFSIGTLKFYAILPSMLAMWLILSILLGLVINLAYSYHELLAMLEIPLLLLYIVWIKFYINCVIDKVYHPV